MLEFLHVYVDAVDLSDSLAYANSFAAKSGATILGVFPEYLLNVWRHE